MKLEVAGAIDNLVWTVDHHYLHLKNQHPFMRAFAVQFELAYTDFRVIQISLQLAGADQHQLLADFTQTYDAIQQYEWSFVKGDLPAFNEKYGDKLAAYAQTVTRFDQLIGQVRVQNSKEEES